LKGEFGFEEEKAKKVAPATHPKQTPKYYRGQTNSTLGWGQSNARYCHLRSWKKFEKKGFRRKLKVEGAHV